MRQIIQGNPQLKICVLGGSGFVGSHLCAHLNHLGHRVRVPSRHPERHRELQVLPGVEIISTNIHNLGDLKPLFYGCDVVINLVAILNENKRGEFHTVHIKLPEKIAQIAKENRIKRLIHMSALNADAEYGKSQYLKSKGMGEDYLHKTRDLNVTSFRPSVIFGPDDHFFNRFATLLIKSPLGLPLACPGARFAPVYVNDVVQAITNSIQDENTFGSRYDLCGPETFTLYQLVDMTADMLKLKRRIWPLNPTLSKLQALVFGSLPGKLFTLDNFNSLQVDSVCKSDSHGLEELGINPTSIKSVVPGYLASHERRARLYEYQDKSRHNY